jgi:hypothetical protein
MIAKGYIMSDEPAKKQDQFIVRFPDGMRDKIKKEADLAGRSMNAEIVLALSFHLDSLDHDRQYKVAQAAWDAEGSAALEQNPNFDLGQMPATKNDMERILRQIQELMPKK